jgi:site-specific DNA-cytosine methylase
MVEKDREKCTYLRINFEKLKIDFEIICRDVREIDLIKSDIITASPPCEDLTILRYFSKNNINKGTIPLTIWTINYVNEAKPKIAFYENVYSKTLADILRKHGWIVEKFNMDKIIPQKRVRLIGYWYRRKQLDLNLLLQTNTQSV